MRNKIFSLVEAAIRELNEELHYDSLVNVNEDTVIFGGEDGIDSLSLAALVVGLEVEVEEEFGRQVLLADERAMSMHNSPYRTIRSLSDLILERLQDQSD
jgi:acyl carrier protein